MFYKIILLFFGSFLLGQNHLNDFQLNGKVKSLESTTYLVTDPKTQPSGFLDSENYDAIKLGFDPNGNLVLRENYLDYRGKLGLFDQTMFQFNYNNQIEKQETILIQNGEEPRKLSQKKHFYYLGNQLIRMDEFNFGRTTDQFWVTNFVYEGGRLKRKYFWMEDAVFSRSEFENRLMKITSEKTFHNDGKLGKTINYKYDENAKLILKSSESGNEKTVETFTYNDKKLESHIVEVNGQIILNETFDSAELPRKILKFNYKTKQFDLYQFKYELDSQNNWINCLILEEEKPKFKIVRKINYY